MAARGLAAVMVSVTTLDRDLCRSLEPRAATPAKRLATIKALAEAGIPVTVSVAPVIPVITDHELERILEAAAKAGAIGASTILLRLPLEVKDLFAEWLELHAPGKAAHVLSLLRQSRDGKLNEARFGKRMEGSGPFAELLAQRFRLACRKLGLGGRMAPLDCGQFRPPPRPGDQLRLF
jgi:DNA repair photolyase